MRINRIQLIFEESQPQCQRKTVPKQARLIQHHSVLNALAFILRADQRDIVPAKPEGIVHRMLHRHLTSNIGHDINLFKALVEFFDIDRWRDQSLHGSHQYKR